jgi:hypothetical protein
MNYAPRTRRTGPRRLIALALATLLTVGLTACGDDSDSETIAVSEWVAEFDRLCVELAEESSDPDMTEAQFQTLSDQKLSEMRAIPGPDENAEEAEALLEAIETTVTDDSLSDEQIAEFDQQFLEAAAVLGISDECLRGSPD